MRLKDKVAIVTGGARGIGKEYSLRFAEEGAKVTICDILDCAETAGEIEAKGGEVLALKTDVASEESTVEMAKKTVERFGRIDILANNAAIYGGLQLKPFHEVSVDEWDKMMAVNLRGTWLCCKAVFPYMKEQGYGKIVNLASEVFFTGSNGFAHYVASKGGIIGLTRALAIELGPHNICINCVAPGFTDTEASRQLADIKKYDTSRTPLGRMGNPDDLTGTALFLASPESDFITGQTLLVDGGRAMH